METIVGTSILALVMLTVLALLTTVNRSSKKAEFKARAAALCENVIEDMRHQAFSELDTTASFEIPVDTDVWDLPNVTAEAAIEEVPGFDGRLKEVTLTVRWTEFGRPGRLVQRVRISSLRH